MMGNCEKLGVWFMISLKIQKVHTFSTRTRAKIFSSPQEAWHKKCREKLPCRKTKQEQAYIHTYVNKM